MADHSRPTSGPGGADHHDPGHEVRIGHDERQRASDDLAEHFAAGRLEQSEFEERTDAVWQAKTLAELQPLFFDLPGGSLNGYLTSQAASGAERSSRAPATRAATPTGDSETGASTGPSAGSKVLQILMGTFPIFMLILFIVLRSVGFEMAWLVFLFIPIFYVAVGVLRDGDDNEDDDGLNKDER